MTNFQTHSEIVPPTSPLSKAPEALKEGTDRRIEILFVDDEPILLHGLRRMLKDKVEKWNMEFVESGQEALEKLQENSYDIVISDMRMPEMDGTELLNAIKDLYPDVVRIILSGYSEKDMILRSVGTAHQYLSKPFNTSGLEETIARSLSLKEVLSDKSLQHLVSKIDQLPSLPKLYEELMDEVSREDPDNLVIAGIINRDIGMTAKILQIINSAFFGLRRSVSDVPDAVKLLGTDTIKALALSVGVFAQIRVPREFNGELNRIWQHSMEVGLTAKAISTHEGSVMTDEAFTVGFLHDVGTLVMLLNMPELYREAVQLSEEEGLSQADAEIRVYGTTHGAIGAYLLGLWGLPRNMVEAVAFYNDPGSHSYRSFRPLTALHIAHVLCCNKNDSVEEVTPKFDTDYLTRIGSLDRVPDWYELFQALQHGDK